MKIRTLRYFAAVAHDSNMTRAAEILGVSQPTLSKQLKALERELGQKLFIRHSFSIELTDEGRLLRDRADDLIRLADRIETEFAALRDITGGDLHLGLAESFQIRLIAGAIRRLKANHPGLRYHITSGDTEQVTEKLDRGVLDFAALVEEPDATRYDVLRLPAADLWGVVMRRDDPLARSSALTIDDLAGLPLFCSEQSWASDIPRWAGKRMKELHLEGTFRLAYNGSVFAREGLGYLLTFDRLVDTGPTSDLVFRPLSPTLTSPVYLIWRKGQVFSPIAERFLEQVRSTMRTEEVYGDDPTRTAHPAER
ncbi:LysR family transcriptional regulator [Actinobaculum sp. 352]|uniref:LysR family transcriptional regulator n=1 Tax=Actinobaculum sp. 352 TaxID=2490946 RepID=UPI000F7E421D|nr:LysR family transcriptional regulator [Actinobaculum sp. 352]RTE50811.1 LysR family transcriptional regulator [Actinobaculum sp. 352]